MCEVLSTGSLYLDPVQSAYRVVLYILRTEGSVLHWVQATTNFNSHGLSVQPLSTLLEDCIQPILDGIPLSRYPLPVSTCPWRREYSTPYSTPQRAERMENTYPMLIPNGLRTGRVPRH